MFIRNKEDLKLAYITIKIYETVQDSNDDIKQKIIEIKQKIRDFYRKDISRGKLVKDYGIDGGILLIELPEFLKSQQEAEEYFRKNEVITMQPSIYDCTGQAFTVGYKIFKRRNKFFAYHSVAFDV